MASKHPLRRSCAFCRARKIKCSNETICEACRKQGVDCIYDFEPQRPKARSTSQDISRPDAAALRGESAHGAHRNLSSTVGSPSDSPIPTLAEEPIPIEEGDNIARSLEHRFYENFSTDTGPRSSPYQERISAYNRSVQNSARERPESMAARFAKFTPQSVKHTSILSLLTNDLVGLVADYFGSLGCYHVEDGSARFFLSKMDIDKTQTMFDNAPQSGNPLSEYGQRQRTQLIDVWFSMHPLSFIVSKTLLLREIRDGTHDEILLAVMLADANFSIGDEVSTARGHVLHRWATAQLRFRPVRPDPSSANGGSAGGISTRIFSGISTAQALMLLAWHALTSFQIRRASCYIGLSAKISAEIKEQISTTAVSMTSSRINGIDVIDVEKEIVAYLYWTTYSLSLWAFVQMGNGHFSALLPTSLTSVFLPVTEASSVIIQLDLVSENFSTIQKQKSVIREMWPLAHISSVVAYIYALYPTDADLLESPSTSYWQEVLLLALQRLQQGKPTQDISAVCREINRVLMESIHILNRQVTEISSRSLVLVVYHSMAIHFLFPVLSQGEPEEALTAETVERFCASTQEILNSFASVADQPHDLYGVAPSLRLCFSNVLCLALDTCARALSRIHTKKNVGALLMDAPMAQAYEGRLEALAGKLYKVSQHDLLAQGKSLRSIRKHLRTCLRGFDHWSGSNSSASSPDRTRDRGLSSSESCSNESDIFSQAPTAVDSRSSYFCATPMDARAMKSSVSLSGMPSSDTASSTGATHPFSTPDDLQKSKAEWSPDDMFQGVLGTLDPSVLERQAGDHLSVADLGDMQNAWFPQMHDAMDFDMTDAMAGSQWDWSDMGGANAAAAAAAAAATPGVQDVHSVLYYFKGGHFHDGSNHQPQSSVVNHQPPSKRSRVKRGEVR